jgi:S1-C subfamily serine protease/regulator of sirC expression with transglutaminase-like and TPR domain
VKTEFAMLGERAEVLGMRFLPWMLSVLTALVLSMGTSLVWGQGKVGEGPERSVADIAASIRGAVVKVTQVGREGAYGVGTGFVVSEDGLIATNRHVIGEARGIRVETSDGKVHEVTEVFASDTRLDLALVRIGAKGLKPLPLGDSDALRQGEPIVAMGNPEGLTYSVVEGVVSEVRREIEGVGMIQLAVPIERGNSGGPLLDRQGRVVGILTLKSARTENLGFAMPVNELKRLRDKPNPVPMSRWLTIGVLDSRVWKPLMGARWSQRAGVIRSELPGEGFGGRAVCLFLPEEPEGEFEVSVETRLEDEAGAAGLAFCSDGGDRHYGFYPTGGRLRLTRFDGPNVFSWKILQDIETEAYRKGDWNTLRVRVTATGVEGFVNGVRVVSEPDVEMRGGRVGLCKFRSTVASFRRFGVGRDLSEKPVSKEVAERMGGAVDRMMAKGRADAGMSVLLDDAVVGRKVLEERRRLLERQVLALRDAERDLHRLTVTREILGELGKAEGEVDLLRSGLLLAWHDNPDLDVDSYLRSFDRMAAELKGDAALASGTAGAVDRIRRYLFEENGFHGSREDYANRSNSYLNEVLDDREGLPISLSVVFVELARRLGIREVVGLPLPSKFMVGFRERAEDAYRVLDVFEGGKELSLEDAAARVGIGLEEAGRAATQKEILVRMIRNLMGSGDAAESALQRLPYLDLLLTLDPEQVAERLRRARARELTGDREGALADLAWLMEHPWSEFDDRQREAIEGWVRRLTR